MQLQAELDLLEDFALKHCHGKARAPSVCRDMQRNLGLLQQTLAQLATSSQAVLPAFRCAARAEAACSCAVPGGRAVCSVRPAAACLREPTHLVHRMQGAASQGKLPAVCCMAPPLDAAI